ncbi:MAG TPA: type ISP restriction/modification enzyme, partial [Pyrinomonadaceae bacterium]|nr:type ISP restriction/modification enzyme [Pyrinomonadaceae bacterium]
RIVERKGEGVVSFISNYSWLDSRSCPGMRERYLKDFDHIWIDSLNGDKYRTGKVTPDGKSDPSVFSTDLNREGIQVGTAIALLVRKPDHQPATTVEFRDWWGKEKRSNLLANLAGSFENQYESLIPELRLGLPFRPALLAKGYDAWPLLPQLLPLSFPGVKTSRDDFVVDIDREELLNRLQQYFDPTVSHNAVTRVAGSAMENASKFEAIKVREYLLARGFLPENVVRYSYRPFDLRWLYWEPDTNLVDRNRPEYFPHVVEENIWLAAAQQNRKEFNPPVVTSRLGSLHLIERGANLFPLKLISNAQGNLLASAEDLMGARPNLSSSATAYLSAVNSNDADLFYHIVAILYAPSYAAENLGALRQDWPRIPLPSTREALLRSAALGRDIASLLDAEKAVNGITGGTIHLPFKSIGSISHVDGKPLKPNEDLRVTANWGYRNQAGATMPGKGKVIEREYATDERKAIADGAERFQLSAEEALTHLGERTSDVYLNDVAYWKNIPARVWDYTIGGYQVMKKWLSYRELELLGRPLTPDEAREVMNIARRLAAIVLSEQALDVNYQSVKHSLHDWTPEKR